MRAILTLATLAMLGLGTVYAGKTTHLPPTVSLL